MAIHEGLLIIETMTPFEITWEAPEFEYREKDVSWYWITIIIAAIVIAFSVWEKNFLFGFFIIVAEVLVIAWGNQKPRSIEFAMREDGIAIGTHKFHVFKEFESWSVEAINAEWVELGFNFRAKLKTPLKLIAPEHKLEEIRKNLKTTLREVEHQLSLIDAIEKLLRF